MSSGPAPNFARLLCMKQGGPFEIVQVPKPTLAPDHVLIRQRIITLNGLDRKQRDYGVQVSHWPFVLGIEGAGTIEAVGADVTDLSLGDEVTALMGGMAHGQDWGGSYQECVVMPACYVAKKPKNISLEEAASLPICYNTAVIAILWGLKIPLPYFPNTPTSGRMPTSILILGGGSGVGSAAIQLLRLAYPSLAILATSSPQHHVHLASLGATQLFDYHSSTVVLDIKKSSPGAKGVDMIIDCVSAGLTQTDICDVLDDEGSKMYASVITGLDSPVVAKGVTKILINGWSLTEMQGGEHIIPTLTRLVEEGHYKTPLPVKVVGHGLEQVPKVMDKVDTASGEKFVVVL